MSTSNYKKMSPERLLSMMNHPDIPLDLEDAIKEDGLCYMGLRNGHYVSFRKASVLEGDECWVYIEDVELLSPPYGGSTLPARTMSVRLKDIVWVNRTETKNVRNH